MKKRIIKLTESDLRIISEQGISNSDKQIIIILLYYCINAFAFFEIYSI